MILGALLTLGLAQCSPYTRTHTVDSDPASPCLYWRERSAIELRINELGNPENAGDTEFVAVERAAATWQVELTACGSLALSVGPRTPSRLAAYEMASGANQNVVLWRFQGCAQAVAPADPCWAAGTCGNLFDCWEHTASALALTTTSFEPTTGEIADTDIELNTPRFLFTTVDSPACVSPNFNQGCVATDIQNALTHELGHSLGLAHNCRVTSTMAPTTVAGEVSKRVLDYGSRLAICELYPADAGALRCGAGGGGGGGSGAGGGGAGGGAGGGGSSAGGGGGGTAGGAGTAGAGGSGGGEPRRGCGCAAGAEGALTLVVALLGLRRGLARNAKRRA